MPSEVTISRHGYRRARQRLGWNRSATLRMAKRIAEQCKFIPARGHRAVAYYGGFVFVFADDRRHLITVIPQRVWERNLNA